MEDIEAVGISNKLFSSYYVLWCFHKSHMFNEEWSLISLSTFISHYSYWCSIFKKISASELTAPRGQSRGDTPPETTMSDENDDEFEDNMNQMVYI